MAGTERLRKRAQLRRSLKRPIGPNLFSLHVLSTHSAYTHLLYFLVEIDRVIGSARIHRQIHHVLYIQITVLPTMGKVVVVVQVPD